jgi:hypothetical protein
MAIYQNITGDTPIAALTVSQFVELLEKGKSPELAPAPRPEDYTQGFVYGIKGIEDLFKVCHSTAQHYKDTFLQPAVKQNGRVIVVDVAKALELFDKHNK